MLNLRKTADEINRLRNQVANQKDTIEKAMKVIEKLADDCCRLQAENQKLQKLHDALADKDIIFPNTDERGLGEGDTPNDLSPLDL